MKFKFKYSILIFITFLVLILFFIFFTDLKSSIALSCVICFFITVIVSTICLIKKIDITHYFLIPTIFFIGAVIFLILSPEFSTVKTTDSFTADTATIYSTDLYTLSPTTNGVQNNAIEATTQIISNVADNTQKTVYITKSGKKFHNKECYILKGKGTPISYNKAISKGKTACKICKP